MDKLPVAEVRVPVGIGIGIGSDENGRQEQGMNNGINEKFPRVTIQFCTQCKWMLRAAYVCIIFLVFGFVWLVGFVWLDCNRCMYLCIVCEFFFLFFMILVYHRGHNLLFIAWLMCRLGLGTRHPLLHLPLPSVIIPSTPLFLYHPAFFLSVPIFCSSSHPTEQNQETSPLTQQPSNSLLKNSSQPSEQISEKLLFNLALVVHLSLSSLPRMLLVLRIERLETK